MTNPKRKATLAAMPCHAMPCHAMPCQHSSAQGNAASSRTVQMHASTRHPQHCCPPEVACSTGFGFAYQACHAGMRLACHACTAERTLAAALINKALPQHSLSDACRGLLYCGRSRMQSVGKCGRAAVLPTDHDCSAVLTGCGVLLLTRGHIWPVCSVLRGWLFLKQWLAVLKHSPTMTNVHDTAARHWPLCRPPCRPPC